jgi:ribosome-binding protein aMBF1 (putative translation factor)
VIKNDLQYKVAKAALKRFQATLDQHADLTADQETWVRELHAATITGEIQKLKEEIADYERTKSGSDSVVDLSLVDRIPALLIKRRIALGWSQRDLAKRLRVSPQQVQNDEATNYASASLARLSKVAAVLRKGRRAAATTGAGTAPKRVIAAAPKKPTGTGKARRTR